jgi:hypothetical protein
MKKTIKKEIRYNPFNIEKSIDIANAINIPL